MFVWDRCQLCVNFYQMSYPCYLSREARNLSPYPMADLKDEAWEVRQDAPPAPLAAAIQHSQSNDQLNPQLSFAFVYKAVGSYTSM